MNGFEAALRAERITNARRAALMRAVIVAAFLANYLSLVFFVHAQPLNAGTALFPAYFLVAAVIVVLTRRSTAVADFSWYFIPFFDMPLLFAFEILMISARGAENVTPSFLFLTALYLLLILFAVLGLRARVVLVAAATAIALCLAFAWRAEIEGRLWPLLSVMLLAAFTAAALYALRRLDALLRRAVDEQTRLERLKRYFSPQVAALLEEHSAGEVGTATRTITVLFGDIRGFTAITHDEPPERVLELLNEYHTVMVERIFESGGTLDKFIGDGVMTYFNAPLDQPDHAERAVRCATSMMLGLEELNRRRVGRGEVQLRMGIGIHTGPATLGSIGPEVRREYTAIGETVNLAAHLEHLTRATGGGILLTESTRRGLGDGIVLEPRQELHLGELDQAIPVYRLVGIS